MNYRNEKKHFCARILIELQCAKGIFSFNQYQYKEKCLKGGRRGDCNCSLIRLVVTASCAKKISGVHFCSIFCNHLIDALHLVAWPTNRITGYGNLTWHCSTFVGYRIFLGL